MAKLHSSVVVIRCGVDTAHHTLVITEEEDGQGSNAVDSREKAALLKLMDDIGARDDIHGRWW